MKNFVASTALLLVSLSLAACSTSGGGTAPTTGGGGTGTGGTGGGGTGGGTGGGGTGGGTGGGGIQLFGLKSSYTKTVQQSPVVVGAPTIYESSEYFISDDPRASGPVETTGSLALPGGQQANGGSAKAVSDAGTVDATNGQVLPRYTGQQGFYQNTEDPDAYAKSDLLRVTSHDLDGDNADDFFVVEQHIGYSSFSGPTETITTMYGGDIAPESAIAGKKTATYRRSRSDGGAEFQYKTGPGLTQQGASFTGDATIVADFTNGTVDATIDNSKRYAGTKGPSQISVNMTGATLNGTQFAGGTVVLRDESNGQVISNFGTNAGYAGALFGDAADHAGGVFQGVGSINGNNPGMIKGWFLGDEVPATAP
tara:strand:- start:22577 stop:23680 length:1104 start_codon:yes stop_codon:yes gene_type:complete